MPVYWSTDAYAPDDTSLPELANMPKVNIRSAACVERAVEHFKEHPTLSVPQLMKLADFFVDELWMIVSHAHAFIAT